MILLCKVCFQRTNGGHDTLSDALGTVDSLKEQSFICIVIYCLLAGEVLDDTFR